MRAITFFLLAIILFAEAHCLALDNISPFPFERLRDPFTDLADSRDALRSSLKLLRSSVSKSDNSSINEYITLCRIDALSIVEKGSEFTKFYANVKLSPEAERISKPSFEVIQSKDFQKEKNLLPQNFEQASFQDIIKVYQLYMTIPLPAHHELDKYREVRWDEQHSDR